MTESKGNIVVVEDDPAMNLALQRLLKVAGFRSLAFDSAEDLLEDRTAAATADCFILDVHLTGLSGLELRRRLQERGTDLPTIFITADEDPFLSSRHPTAAFLRKPFSSRRLLIAVREALDRVTEEAKRL
jgi:FixJ family two-component response regulator